MMRLSRALVIPVWNAVNSVLFVTFCLSTLCIVRKFKMHTKAGYPDGRGVGAAVWAGRLGVGKKCQPAMPIRGRFLIAPITGSRVAFNTTHTTALPSPCLRMALWLGGGAPSPGQAHVPCGWPCAPLPSAPAGC